MLTTQCTIKYVFIVVLSRLHVIVLTTTTIKCALNYFRVLVDVQLHFTKIEACAKFRISLWCTSVSKIETYKLLLA